METLPGEQFLPRAMATLVRGWNELGLQAVFYARVIMLIPLAVTRHRTELLRVIAQMALGKGTLAMIGGAFGVFGSITFFQGMLTGVLAFNELQSVGVDALTGLAGAVVNLRFLLPATCVVILVATIGAGATAQLGAMRINEEIDALDVIGIRSIGFLAATQVVAGVVTIVPLYSVETIVMFFATRITNTVFQGQETGNYDHYFDTFFTPANLIWSFLMTEVVTVVAMLVHTYYGYNAHGGPAGVGEAVGRSVRNTLILGAMSLALLSLAIFGQSGNFRLAS
jgi:phospholipid/cholesterol/gamma-HCH transport system permease protein